MEGQPQLVSQGQVCGRPVVFCLQGTPPVTSFLSVASGSLSSNRSGCLRTLEGRRNTLFTGAWMCFYCPGVEAFGMTEGGKEDTLYNSGAQLAL